jgi:SPP1 gp7 family putative phage head morphogenesis protein
MTRKAFEKLVDVKRSEAFYVAGLEKKNIEKDIQPLIVQAINEGWDLRDFEFALDQVFVKYKEPTFNQVGKEGEKILDFHTQTVFRNAMMTSYNEGREQMRQDPDVIETFPADFYSSIMDNRTTKEICRLLDGSVFLTTDPRWDKFKPQNHHMCRAILITINKFDFTPDMLSPLPSVVIPVGFGG